MDQHGQWVTLRNGIVIYVTIRKAIVMKFESEAFRQKQMTLPFESVTAINGD